MGLRKASAYSKMKVRPYTRKSKLKGKNYIKTVPAQTITKFAMGSEKNYNDGKYPFHMTLVSEENVQLRDGAVEACRQVINKLLETFYPNQYFFRVMVYPHHIQRENKMLTGAGADRMSTGMQLSFGKTMDRAALVKKGHGIFFMALENRKPEKDIREAVNSIRPKLPCTTRVVVEDLTPKKEA